MSNSGRFRGRAAQPSAVGPEQPASSGARDALLSILVIAVAIALAYSNTFDAAFHLDDRQNIVENSSIRALANLWPPSGSRWIAFLSFALNYRVGGLAPFGYHLVNLLIHACNAILVFWLTATTLRTPALRDAQAGPLVRRHLPLAAGLLFALHPVQTEAVTYVVQRMTSLATLFYLLSLTLHAKARLSLEAGRPRARTVCMFALSATAGVAAMETKEISFTLPFVAAGYEILLFRAGKRLRLLALVPLAATALLVPLGIASQGGKVADILSDASHLTSEAAWIPRSVYLLTQSRVVVTYLRMLLLPVGQNLDHDVRLSESFADPSVLLSIAVLLSVVSAAVFLLVRALRTKRGEGTLVFFGIAWFFLTVSVESSVIPIRDVMFEHRMYLPSVGGAVALGTALLWAVERLHLRRPLGLQCAAALLVTAGPLGAATYERNLVWKDELTLWSDVVAKSPHKPRPHKVLGDALLATGRTDDAIREYRDAIRLDPWEYEAHNNLGFAYGMKGQLEDAVREYREAVRLESGPSNAHAGLGDAYETWNGGLIDDDMRRYRGTRLALTRDALGFIYARQGRIDDAMSEYREAIFLDPGLAQAHANLGEAYATKGQMDDALREYREAARIVPLSGDAHYTLGNGYRTMGRLDDAIREYGEAIRLSPHMSEAHNNLGVAYGDQLDRATSEFREAVRLAPENATYRYNLAYAYQRARRLDDALSVYREALRLDPRLVQARFGLAATLEASGRRAEAIAAYQRFVEDAGDQYPDHAEEANRRIARLRAAREPAAR